MYHCLIKIQLQTFIKIMSYIDKQVAIGICFDERRANARVVREGNWGRVHASYALCAL